MDWNKFWLNSPPGEFFERKTREAYEIGKAEAFEDACAETRRLFSLYADEYSHGELLTILTGNLNRLATKTENV